MTRLKKKTEKEINDTMINSLNNLDIEELAELCSRVTEKHLSPDNELYKYYHELIDKLRQKTK